MELVINGRFLTQQLSGVQRVALEVTRAIDRLLAEGALSSWQVRIAAPHHAQIAHLGLDHIPLVRSGRLDGQLWEQITLPRMAKGAALLSLANTAPLWTLIWGGRAGVMLHDQAYRLFPQDYSRAYRLWHHVLDAAIVRRATPLFTVSDAERRGLTTRYPALAGRIETVPNGGWMNDQVEGAQQEGPSDPDGYGLYVGRLSERKNMGRIVDAAVAAARSRGRRFVLVGPVDPQVEALKAAIPPDVRGLIEFRGYVADADLPALYRGAAYLLYPSFYEASGLPPTEAMMFGCPVIVSDLPVLRERCGDAAIYCDAGDLASIVDAIHALLDDRVARTRLAEGGRARARMFTWRNQALRILDAIAASVDFRSAAYPGRPALVETA